jgi:hypothetical protein
MSIINKNEFLTSKFVSNESKKILGFTLGSTTEFYTPVLYKSRPRHCALCRSALVFHRAVCFCAGGVDVATWRSSEDACRTI